MNAITPRRAFLGALASLPFAGTAGAVGVQCSPSGRGAARALGETDPVLAAVADLRANRAAADAMLEAVIKGDEDEETYSRLLRIECRLLERLAEAKPATVHGVAEYLQVFVDLAEDCDCREVAVLSAIDACRQIGAA